MTLKIGRTENPHLKFKRLCLVLIFACSGFAHGTENLSAVVQAHDFSAGQQVRAFLKDMINAGSSSKEARAQSVRKAFADHPEVFQMFAETNDPKTLLKEAGLQDVQIPLSGNKEVFEELQTLTKNEIRDWIIDTGLQKELGPISEHLRIESAMSTVVADLGQKRGKHFSKAFANLSPQARIAALKTIHDGRFDEIAEKVNHLLLQAKFSDSDAIRQLTGSGAIKYDKIPVPAEEISGFIARYFDDLDLATRQRVLIGLLELPPGASAERQLSVFIQRAGPALQKFFQLAGRGAESVVLKKVLEELQANVEPFPVEHARATIEKSLGGPVEKLFRSFDDTPLAAGTIGQVHRAVLHNGKEVIIKVRRPGIVEQVASEMEILRRIAADTRMSGMVEQLWQSLLRELDFRIEAKNLDKGVKVYSNPKKGIEIPARIKKFPIVDDVLVVEMAKGRQPRKMKTLLIRRGEALSGLLEQWIDVAIFQDGFFNSDLHPGNIFLERVRKSDLDLLIHPIDFGNSGRLTISERRAFMRLSLGAMAHSPDRMMEAVTPLVSSLTDAQRKAALKALEGVDFSKLKTSEAVERFLGAVVAQGVEVPADLLNFQRGKVMLEGQIADINKKLSRLNAGTKPFDPEKLYKRLAFRRLAVALPKQAVSGKARRKAVVSASDLTRALLDRSGLVDAHFNVANSCLIRGLIQWIR